MQKSINFILYSYNKIKLYVSRLSKIYFHKIVKKTKLIIWYQEAFIMKNVKKVSKVLCAFGVSTVLLAGVVGAASNHAYNNHSNWNGVGSVAPSAQANYSVDYMGAVTVFHQQFPGASVKSISYDAKHNPYYEVEGYYNNREVEIKVDEATGQIVGKEVKGYTKGNKAINVQNIIIPEVAETKAIEKVGADFQTMEWTVERENGRAVYEFDMTTGGGKKAEVKVDGMNGKVLSAKVKNTKY